MSMRGWVARARAMIAVPFLLPRARYVSLALRSSASSGGPRRLLATRATRRYWSAMARPNRDDVDTIRRSSMILVMGRASTCGNWVNSSGMRRATITTSSASNVDRPSSVGEVVVLERPANMENGVGDGESSPELIRDREKEVEEEVLTRQAWMERAEAHRQRQARHSQYNAEYRLTVIYCCILLQITSQDLKLLAVIARIVCLWVNLYVEL